MAEQGAAPLVAIGGITLGTVASVLEAGASSAAVITDIVTNLNPEERTRSWIAATSPGAELIHRLFHRAEPTDSVLTARPLSQDHQAALEEAKGPR